MRMCWYYQCYVCDCPLDPKIRTRDKDNKAFIKYYKHIRPLFTYNNAKYYSFVKGLTVKPVCYSCFLNKPKVDIKSLKKRELGLKTSIVQKSKSKTKDEIMFWFDGLLRRAMRNGLDIKN